MVNLQRGPGEEAGEEQIPVESEEARDLESPNEPAEESPEESTDDNVGESTAPIDQVIEPAGPVVVNAITVDRTGPVDIAAGHEHAPQGESGLPREIPAPTHEAPAATPGMPELPREVNEPRNLELGQRTAEGLATMTPVARQTEAGHRFLGDVALRLDHLTKRYGSVRAVNDVSYEIRQGSFSGIVGPNGAGKTTTLMMMAGLLKPTSGTVHVGDTDVWKQSRVAYRKIGTLPDRLRMFDQLTGAQYLDYVGTLRGLKRNAVAERTESLLDAFELRNSANRLVVDYSAGLRKKLALAATLIHSPEVLILDEPFETIDPVSAGVLIDVLIDYADRGGTVVLSSHSMDLVQRVCDHVAVIAKGEVIAEGTVDEVRGGITLEERFRNIVRGPVERPGLDWLEISFG